jgi:hypothetical protein
VDDLLIGGADADVLDGGSGDDTASYETATTGILLNLATLEATGDAQGDVFVSIEQYEGSEYDDTLIGDATDNVLGGLGATGDAQGDVFVSIEQYEGSPGQTYLIFTMLTG